MKIADAKKMSAADIAAAVNAETKSLGSSKGTIKTVGMYLAALAFVMRDDASNKIKTLAKYADGKGVNVRDVPRQSFCLANVAVELLGDGADDSATVNETHLAKASVHTLNAASAALNTLARKVAASEVSATEASGFRVNIAKAVRGNSEKDAKAQSETLAAPGKAKADEEKEREAKKTPAQKLLEALVAVAKMIAATELSESQLATVEKWRGMLGEQIAERVTTLAAKAAGETEAAGTAGKAEAKAA
jgi:hypothetical protein